MPQKKNPDSLELLRGKSGRVFGNVRRDYASALVHLSFLLFVDVWLLDDIQGLAVDLQQGPAGG